MRQHFTSRTLLLSLAVAAATTAAQQTCYGTNGTLAISNIEPCNKDAPAGTHVACCDLGKSPPDICVNGGLCMRQDNTAVDDMIYAVGCTDQTGDAAECQQFCRGHTNAAFYELHVCADGSWCCSSNASERCCLANGNGDVIMNLRDILPIAKAVTVTAAGGKAATTATISFTTSVAAVTDVATETVTGAGKETQGAGASVGVDAGTGAEVCPKDRSTVVGASVGAVLGACLIASLISLGVVLRRQKGDRRGEAKGMLYLPGTPPVEMDSRYVVELDSRAKHELGGQPSP